MRRAAVVSTTLIAFGLLLPPGVSANADSSVPAPSLSIIETVLGQRPPAVSSTGRWDVTDPGKAASLQVSGLNPPAGQTIVSAVWTSHPWRPRKGTAINATWGVTQEGVSVGSSGGSWSIQMGMRTGSGRWSSWSGASGPFAADSPHVVTYSAGPGRSWTEFLVRPKHAVQFQFRVRYSATAAGQHTASFTVATAN